MQVFSRRGAKGFVVAVFGSALLLAGCSHSMMAEKKMMDKDTSKESMSKDDAMKKEEMMKDKCAGAYDPAKGSNFAACK